MFVPVDTILVIPLKILLNNSIVYNSFHRKLVILPVEISPIEVKFK